MNEPKDGSSKMDKNIIYQKVRTTPVRIKLILVDGSKIEGTFHQPPNLRLTDMLNRNIQDNPFMAVTDANVVFADGEHAEYKFFNVNRNMILCCFPVDEEIMRGF
ncbi:MAG TPA: hypothetical protein ENK33_04375 [Desulfobacterales bacterium]|nr:hypothetical protein [Desulfobacterales bacterium]